MNIFARIAHAVSSLLPRKSAPSLSGMLAGLPDARLQHILHDYLDGGYPTQPMAAVPSEQSTGEIDEHAVSEAMKAVKAPTTEGIPVVRGKALDVDVKKLKTGELIRWYRDLHRKAPMTEATMEYRITHKLERQAQ